MLGELQPIATTTSKGLMSSDDKKNMPMTVIVSPIKVSGVPSGYGFFCQVTATGYEGSLYFINRSNNNVYYTKLAGGIGLDTVSIKDEDIYIAREGVRFHLSNFQCLEIKISYVTSIPDGAIPGTKK